MLVKRLPQWAPRVTQWQIRCLYDSDALGIQDEELIDEVGYALAARCQSFIEAVEAVRGRAKCPACGAIVMHGVRSEELLTCSCGWELLWKDYFATIQHKQLSGAEPVLEPFRAYIRDFPGAGSPRDKMMHIDTLIHGFHVYSREGLRVTRPVAVNLIEGRLNDVVAFLDDLAASDRSTPGVAENRAAWRLGIDANRTWYNPGA